LAKVEGLERLKARMARIPEATRAEMREALDRSADELIALQRQLAPVDEGDLKQSIRKEPGRTELTVDVVAGGRQAPHAVHVEQGTAKAAAHPFFFPGFRALKPKIKRRLSRVSGKAARRDAAS
jgi:HK97 gp10 family phage protein